jgi:hypothetical protein
MLNWPALFSGLAAKEKDLLRALRKKSFAQKVSILEPPPAGPWLSLANRIGDPLF